MFNRHEKRLSSSFIVRETMKPIVIPKKSLIIKHQRFLQNLLQLSRAVSLGQRPQEHLSSFLKRASQSEIKALCEVSHNFLKGTLGNKLVKQLSPFKGLIRKLACPKTSVRSKRRGLTRKNVQIGGLPFIVPLLAPILGSLIGAGIEAAL